MWEVRANPTKMQGTALTALEPLVFPRISTEIGLVLAPAVDGMLSQPVTSWPVPVYTCVLVAWPPQVIERNLLKDNGPKTMWGVAQRVGNLDWRVFSGRKSIGYHVFGVLVAFPTSSAGGRFLRRPRQSKVVAFAHARQGNAMVNGRIEPNAPQLAATAPSWTGSTGAPGTRTPPSASASR